MQQFFLYKSCFRNKEPKNKRINNDNLFNQVNQDFSSTHMLSEFDVTMTYVD